MAVDRKTALKVEDLSFRYAGQVDSCIQKLNLEVQSGERFGLLGPNGAGKTTLMQLLCGILQPANGTIELFGQNPSSGNLSIRKHFGFVPQDLSFYSELSPMENLEFFGAWYGMSRELIKSRATELLALLGLDNVKNKLINTFSGGMKRRVNLAIGVLHNPGILFLDEPTVGVDVQSRNAIIEYILSLNKKGTTIFYTSHHLQEAEVLCERIALIDEGRIIAGGNVNELLVEYSSKNLETVFLELTGKQYRD